MRKLRIAPVIAVVITGLVASSTPAQADTSVLQRFKADSGDSCPYGTTEGYLNWRYSDPVIVVDVRGTLTDRPVVSDTAACRDDRYYSVATFTAYDGRTIVDKEERRADNQTVSFGFTLASSSFVSRIDLVVVQVCRHPRYGTTPPSYCGPAVEYRPPIVSTP